MTDVKKTQPTETSRAGRPKAIPKSGTSGVRLGRSAGGPTQAPVIRARDKNGEIQ